MKQVLCVYPLLDKKKNKTKMSRHESVLTAPNDTTTQSKKIKIQTQTFGARNSNQWDNMYIRGVGTMSPHRHKHASCSHIMVHDKNKPNEKKEKNRLTVKTAHIKAKKHTVTPRMYTPVRARTRRDRFTLSAHFSFGRSMRYKKSKINPGFAVNTVQRKSDLREEKVMKVNVH